MRYLLILFITTLLYNSFIGQVPYDETNFRAPLNIPLVLAGNFAELRSNHFHTGLDIKTKHTEGYRIYAIDSGYVSRINISHWGYGKAIYVTHPNGYTSVYAHLRDFPKKVEKFLRKKQFELETETLDIQLNPKDLEINRGEVIAYSGNTGSSSAPHLHFEIRETETEYPVNPLLFNFEIKDKIRPDIFNLKVYPINGSINKQSKERVFATVGTNGKYTLKDNPTISLNGQIGFGVHTIDRLDAARNKCGIFTIELEIDEQLVYKQKMEKIDFSTNRYINTHKDYFEYHKKRRSFHKSFKTENNELKIYTDLIKNGLINFDKDTTHQLKYTIKDTYGNTSTLTFKVKSTSTKTPSKTVITNASPLEPYTLIKEDFKAELEAKSLYEKANIAYEKEKTLYSSAPLHKFGDSKLPLQKYFVMKIKTQGIEQDKESKAVIVKVSDDKRKASSKGGIFKEGWVETKVRDFGNYTVKVDSTPPVVTAINISKNKTITTQKNIQFKISDNLSGIKTYRIYIDKQFFLANYIPRRSTLTLTFNEYNKVLKGSHNLRIIVKDERGNTTTKDYPFIKQ